MQRDPPGEAGVAAWHGSLAALLACSTEALAGAAHPLAWWGAVLPLLQAALRPFAAARDWRVILEFRLLRLRCRIDAVLVTDRAVLALLIRPDASGFRAADRAMAEDAALDLADFHAGCRGVPVIPVLLVPNGARAGAQRPLPFPGATPIVETTRLLLPGLLHEVATRFPPVPGTAPADWMAASYRPVPALIEAACMLYARHDVPALLLAQAGRGGLGRTQAAVAGAVRRAQDEGRRLVVFVTGNPGAGKTLCGLNLAFAPNGADAAFLTGNPTLVHVLREALVRDAAVRGMHRRAAGQRMAGVIQALPAFRDHHLSQAGPPPERLVIIDEAQRCWSAAHAIGKTRNRPVRLSDSEPGHVLDIMARHDGWSVVVCLLGGGQEIHDGEGGLAAWGAALAARPGWQAVATPAETPAADPRQRLTHWPGLTWSPGLHLEHPVRPVHAPTAASWVQAVLANDAPAAAALACAAGGSPFSVTRCLHRLRDELRPRGTRRCGLRAEGLGSTLLHQDEDAVARWFLDRWPDVRSSDALETVATEFSVQGLELDHVGLCWDADLVHDGAAWRARSFRATAWTTPHRAEAVSNRLNAYRVLLTRARHGTVIWVPRGDRRDPTRDPALYDGVADFLLDCGAAPLDGTAAPTEDAPMPEAALL